MKILYWTPEFYPEIGGIEELSRRVLPEFQKIDYEFIVFTSHGRKRLPNLTEFNGIPVHRFYFREALVKRDLKQILTYQKQVAELKKEFKPDLIHFNFGDPYGYFHITTAGSYPAPTVVTLHMSIADYVNSPNTMIGKLLKQSSWVVGVSKSILEDAHIAVPEVEQRSSVIYNGLDLPDISPGPLNFDEPCVLCLGRVIEDKGFDLAITAFSDVRKRFPKSRLIIAGDGLAKKNLELQAYELGLADAVEFPGWIEPDQVPDLINMATVVVLPSRWREPFPLVALQAAQMARPAVATRVGGLPESVLHGETGLLVEKENPKHLAGALCFLLKNPEISVQYGLNARKRLCEFFSMEGFVKSYDSLYRKIASHQANWNET